MADIRLIGNTLLDIVAQVTAEEFYWQDAHYSADSRLGRELLYLIANDEWIRTTTEILDVSRADAVDTTIRLDVDLDRITHEAFHEGAGRIWLPLFVHGGDGSENRGTLTVTDADGTQLAPLPQADVRHQIAAALAEIIVNFAVARWRGQDSAGPAGKRPAADRDQRVLLAAALFRLLSGQTDGPPPAAVPASGRLADAQTMLTELLNGYLADYTAERPSRAFRKLLTERAGHIIDAFTNSVVVVVGVDRHQSPVVLNVTAPTRRLELVQPKFGPLRWLTLLRPRAQLRIDLLLPSGDADRQVQVNLPDGVALETRRTAVPTAGLWIRSGPPPAAEHLSTLVSELRMEKAHDHAIRSGLADLALAKTGVLADTLRTHYVVPSDVPGSDVDAVLSVTPAELDAATEDTRSRLDAVRDALVALAGGGPGGLNGAGPRGGGAEREAADIARLGDVWGDGSWLRRSLLRRTSTDSPGPHRMTGQAGLTETDSQRATPDYARVNVPVDVPDASFGLIARFSGTVSALLMAIVLVLFLVDRHGRTVPSPEVLASALTLFSVIQAGRIEIPDRSTLRGLLSGAGTWLIVASLLPTIFLAIMLAFDVSGWVPVLASGAAVGVQLAFVFGLSQGPLSPTAGLNSKPARVLRTTARPGYARTGVLHTDWWRSTTASLLVTGREAHAYVIWEHDIQPSLHRLLDTARRARTPEQLTALAARLRWGQGPERMGSERARQLLATWPPNILALVRSGTDRQALTFLVFREPPQHGWPPPRGTTVRVDRIDPDRLAPVDEATEPVDIWIGVPRDFYPLGTHAVLTVLRCAATRGLLLHDTQFPAPPPAAGAGPADDAGDCLWVRLRIGLHDTEIGELGPFLREFRARLTTDGGTTRIRVRTTPQGPIRDLPVDGVLPVPVREPRLVLASELDAVCVAGASVSGSGSTVGGSTVGGSDGSARNWRVLAICADARNGIESEILDAVADAEPRLRLAALTHAVMHGTSVILMLGHQAGRPHASGRPALRDRLAEAFPGSGLLVAVDEWQSSDELGRAGAEPLLRVRARSQDRPGMLLDVLNSLRPALQSALPGVTVPADAGVWHAMLTVTAGRATTARLTLRLPASPDAVEDWDGAKYGEIEREARYVATQAIAERRAASVLPEGEEFGAPENTVISVNLIRAGDEAPSSRL